MVTLDNIVLLGPVQFVFTTVAQDNYFYIFDDVTFM